MFEYIFIPWIPKHGIVGVCLWRNEIPTILYSFLNDKIILQVCNELLRKTLPQAIAMQLLRNRFLRGQKNTRSKETSMNRLQVKLQKRGTGNHTGGDIVIEQNGRKWVEIYGLGAEAAAQQIPFYGLGFVTRVGVEPLSDRKKL